MATRRPPKARAKTKTRRFSESKWRTDILARDLYAALIVRASKEQGGQPSPDISWEDRCAAAAAEALIAARTFEAIRKATK